MYSIKNLWGPIRKILREKCTSHRIKQIVSPTAIDLQEILSLPSTTNTDDKNNLIEAIDREFYNLDEKKKERFLQIAAEEIINQCPRHKDLLIGHLERLGWTVYEGSLIPIEVLDTSELPELPKESRKDLVKASIRLRDGDLSGSITSSCGAVDSVTAKIYKEKGLGDPGKASFQKKVSMAISAKQILDEIESDLLDLEWKESDANQLVNNLKGAINQAAYVMQSLRSEMGDTHGTKPTLKPLVFDTVKWATLIVRLLK